MRSFAPANPLHSITVNRWVPWSSGRCSTRPAPRRRRWWRSQPPEPVAEPEPQVVADTTGPQDFTLLGVSINGGERFALVRYNKTNEVFRLKSGQYLSDWELRSVEIEGDRHRARRFGIDDQAVRRLARGTAGMETPQEVTPEDMPAEEPQPQPQ